MQKILKGLRKEGVNVVRIPGWVAPFPQRHQFIQIHNKPDIHHRAQILWPHLVLGLPEAVSHSEPKELEEAQGQLKVTQRPQDGSIYPALNNTPRLCRPLVPKQVPSLYY